MPESLRSTVPIGSGIDFGDSLPLPKYFALRNILRERFHLYEPGQRLPSENQLAREAGVSRVTLQRALAGLVNEGIIVRHQGKGSFYTGQSHEHGTQELSGLLEGLMTYEGGARAKVVGKTIDKVPSPDVRSQLKLRSSDRAIVIRRVAFLHGEPLAYIINHLPYEVGIKVYNDGLELQSTPMVSLLMTKYGFPLTRAHQTIEAVLANQEIGEYLVLPVGVAVLRAERTYFAKGSRPIQFTRSWYRSDRYKFTVTLRSWK